MQLYSVYSKKKKKKNSRVEEKNVFEASQQGSVRRATVGSDGMTGKGSRMPLEACPFYLQK